MQNFRDLVGASLVDINSYLNSLGAYDLNEGVDSLLDQSREINDSGKFYYNGVCFPFSGDTNFAMYETKQASINIQPYSFLVSMGIYCADPAGVKFSIYDKGAKTYVFNNLIYALDRTIASSLSTTYPNNDVNNDIFSPDPNGPYFLRSPLIVLPPGVLQIEMTSLSANNNVIAQLLLSFAVPLTPKSINVNVGA